MGYTAIMTETDRARISGETDDPDSKRYESVSRVRKRIEALETDSRVLENHHPELLEELREVVCETDSGGFNEIQGSIDTSLDEPDEDSAQGEE